MTVAIVGSRTEKTFNVKKIKKYLSEDCTELISGGARGVDQAAERFARENGIPFRCFLPDYDAHGKRAPLVRNTEMVMAADEVLAFWDFHSRGTAFTIAECVRLGVPVRIIGLDDEL